MKPAIVISTYNRTEALQRLLWSLSNANYEGFEEIPLVISIDGGGDPKICEIAESFVWEYGLKRIITHEINLGLRNHVLSCGDLTSEYGSIILFEDDLFVSPLFYQYVSQALEFYKDDERIAGIATYARNRHKFTILPFYPISNGFDVYMAQFPSSWGQAFTYNQWRGFRTYYDTSPQIEITDRIPEAVKWWGENSWLKFLVKYMVVKELYFVYPYASHCTNFGDAGQHYSKSVSDEQVPLSLCIDSVKYYSFPSFVECKIKYDVYYDITSESLVSLGFNISNDFVVDLYGIKQLKLFSDKKYMLSIKKTYNPIETFDLKLLPIENNILLNIKGDNVINFAETKTFIDNVERSIFYRVASHGKQDAFAAGLQNIRETMEYRIGYKLLNPITFIKKKYFKK